MLVALVLASVCAAPGTGAADTRAGGDAPSVSEWDPRIRALVRFVERERDLEFDHPIAVEFLDEATFVEALSVEATEEDLELDELYSGDLHALGLVGPDLDLTAVLDDLTATGVYGFYDDETEELKVRGVDLDDVVVRATVVHELTHALQDQSFDIGALRERTKTSGADFALTTLIEGDATWIEEAYVATLPEAEQDRYFEDFAGSAEIPTAPGGDALAVDLLLSLPYSLGYGYVDYLRFSGGTKAVDRAFRTPPPSDEQVIDPVSLVRRERPRRVPKPALGAGEERRGPADEIGAVGLYVVLATRLETRDALAATTGWDGDRYVGYSRDGTDCLRAEIATDDADEAVELADALEEWAGPDLDDAVTVARRGPRVHLDACGVADVALPTEERLLDLTDALSVRFLVFSGIEDVSPTITARQVRCLADLEITDAELRALLFSPDATPSDLRLVDRRTSRYAARCGLVAGS